MVLFLVLFQYIGLVSAFRFFDISSNLSIENGLSFRKLGHGKSREKRKEAKMHYEDDFHIKMPTCSDYEDTKLSPFVVILLYKNAGRFLGMGSIIDKKTVLTATEVVYLTLSKPSSLLILAGYLNPYWGANSQVRKAETIYSLTPLALITTEGEFPFTRFIKPVKLPKTRTTRDIKDEYLETAVVFGVQRTAIDTPGQYVLKGSIYSMSFETIPKDTKECEKAYPDQDYNDENMTCTYSNGSWSWGCIGSPTIMRNVIDDVMYQVAVVIKTTKSDQERFHFHMKIQNFVHWIKAHSFLTVELKGA